MIFFIDAVAPDPRPNEARPLVGYPDLWRIRIGNYRANYTIKDAQLALLLLRVPPAAASPATGEPADFGLLAGDAAPPPVAVSDLRSAGPHRRWGRLR